MTADNFCRQGKTTCTKCQSDPICAPHKSRTVKAGLKCIYLIHIKITVGKFTKHVIKSELPNILLIRKALAN